VEVALSELGKCKLCHVICQSHIDMAWLWRWEETLSFIRDTFAAEVELFEQHQDYTFCQSQLAAYQLAQERFPDLFEKIKQLVAEGRWEVVGGEWVEADHVLPSGESLVRQFLYGQLYTRDVFGLQTKIGWSPDSFGHSGNLPQILTKAGIENFVFKRPLTNELDLPITPFWWQGIDGTRVLAYRTTNKGWDFVNPIPEELVKRHNLHHTWGYSGTGDRGGVRPYKELGEDEHGKHIYSTPTRYFEAVRAEAVDLPVVEGELNYTFEGSYTTHADVKQANRECESLLFLTECLAAAAHLEGSPYPHEQLRDAWRKLLFNQFHDILPGTGIADIYEDAAKDYDLVKKIAHEIIGTSAQVFVSESDLAGIVVFNALPYSRSAEIETQVSGFTAARDVETGRVYPLVEGRFFAQDLPAVSFRTFELLKDAPSPIVPENLTLDNGVLRLSVDPETGSISSVVDLRTGREVIAAPGGNVLALYDESAFLNPGMPEENAYYLLKDAPREVAAIVSKPEPTLSQCGLPAIRCVHRWRNSTFVSTISLPPQEDFVDIRLECDWQETLAVLRTEFTLSIGSEAEAWHEIPYGAVKRERDGQETPSQRWVDLSDSRGGAALINDSRYGHSVLDNTIRMTLLRCATSPDPVSDRGNFTFRYRLCPHSGDWRKAGLMRKAQELNVPVAVISGNAKRSPQLPRIDGGDIEIGACKISENGQWLALRLCECLGCHTAASVILPHGSASAYEANLLEEPLSLLEVQDGRLHLQFGPFEIKTILIPLVNSPARYRLRNHYNIV